MNSGNINIPKWFWIIAAILLLWNIMGLIAFYQNYAISDEALQALPQNEQELYAKYPMWTYIVFAIAVLAGIVGSIALLLKKKMAYPLFLVSFIAIVIQTIHSLLVAKAIDVYGAQGLIMPFIIVSFGLIALWLSKRAVSKNWLN